MQPVKISSPIQKLPAQRGGYFYITVSATLVQQFSKGKKQRLVCTINNALTLNCGVNPLGNGDYFIIVAAKHIKNLQLELGDSVNVVLQEDDNPLGVAMPEVIAALLEQDEVLHQKFSALTDGKKRSVIFAIHRIKNIDIQIATATKLILNGGIMKKKVAG
jgi:hypothetical protein